MKNKLSKPNAITVTANNRHRKWIDVKLCYIVKHPEISCNKWDTETIMTIDPSRENAPDMVMNYRQQYNLPFIPGVWRGNNVRREHINIIESYVPDLPGINK